MKEKILGKTVGKAGISQVLTIKSTFIIAICIILGFFLVISSLVNWGKNYNKFEIKQDDFKIVCKKLC